MEKRFYVASPHGMCGGVYHAVRMLEKALALQQGPVYVLHELVHNNTVTGELTARGVHFVEQLDQVPPGAVLLIGAHGVGKETESRMRSITLNLLDASCPLVKKLHRAAAEMTADRDLLLIGHAGHPELQGILGHSGAGRNFIISREEDLASLPPLRAPRVLSQTTMDCEMIARIAEKLKKLSPDCEFCEGVCAASRQRQQAVRKIAKKTDLMLVLGSAHSSNANRLREVAQQSGCRAVLLDDLKDLPPDWQECSCIGLTSGASTPESFFEEVQKHLEKAGYRQQR